METVQSYEPETRHMGDHSSEWRHIRTQRWSQLLATWVLNRGHSQASLRKHNSKLGVKKMHSLYL